MKEYDKLYCVDCKHFYFSSGSPGYSEYTPGSDASLGCTKQKWEYEPNNDTDQSFRKKMKTADNCEEYEYE